MDYDFGALTMNKYFFRALFFLSAVAHADQTQEAFLKAGAYYEEGRIAQALELYKKIQVPYPSVFYNCGLCYYALEQYPEALVAFRKTQRIGNREVYKKASDAVILSQKKLGIADTASFFETALAIHALIPADLFRFLFLLVLALFSLVVLLGRTTLRLVLVGVFLILSTGGVCGYDYWFSKQQYGVIISKMASVYAGPDKEFHKVAEIPAGQQVKVVEQDHSWYKVYFPVGKGWIEQADLGVF
jgi:tetratricopeptide (TPR) repeat protein